MLKSTTSVINVLRRDFRRRVRDQRMGYDCELCGATDNLTLHHRTPFMETVIEVFGYYGYNVDHLFFHDFVAGDLEGVTLQSIRDTLTEKQRAQNFNTLCDDCHHAVHKYNIEEFMD